MAQKRSPPTRSAAAVTAVDGVDLAALVPIYWAALLKHPLAKPRSRAVPTFAFKRTYVGTNGHGEASGSKQFFTCFFTENCDKAYAMELILHELCHLAIPCDASKEIAAYNDAVQKHRDALRGIPDSARIRAAFHRVKAAKDAYNTKRREEVHGLGFKTVLRDTAVALFGDGVRVRIPSEGRCYILDDLIVREMRKVMGLPWKRGAFLQDSAPETPSVVTPAPVVKPTRFIEKAMELADLPKGTVVRGQIGGGEWSYIKLAGGWAPLSSPNESPYGSVAFFNLCDRISYVQETA